MHGPIWHGSNRMKGQSVRAPHFRVCPFSRSNPPSITAATVRNYRGPTRVGNNNGHWPSAIPEYSILCYDDSIRQWPIPPDNALVKCTAVDEKGWLQNRGAQRPLTLPPRKSVGENVPLFNRRDSFRAGAFSRASLDVRANGFSMLKSNNIISTLSNMYYCNFCML